MSFLERLLARARPQTPRLAPALMPAFALGDSTPVAEEAYVARPQAPTTAARLDPQARVPPPPPPMIAGGPQAVASDRGDSVTATRAREPRATPRPRHSPARVAAPDRTAVPRGPEAAAPASTITRHENPGQRTLERIVERHTETRVEHHAHRERSERVIERPTTPWVALPPAIPPTVVSETPAQRKPAPAAAPVQIHIGTLVVSAPAAAPKTAPPISPPGPTAKSLAQLLADRNRGRR